MITGVYAIILGAATAMLPFTPPAGWVQLPQGAVGARVNNIWQGPKPAHGSPETFNAVAFPFPGTVDMLASAHPPAGSPAVAIKTVSASPLKLCGTPARLSTVRVRAGGVNGILLQEVAVKGGYGYMLMYTRPANAPINGEIGHIMRTFCPSGTADIPTLAMPAGWKKMGGDLQMVGAWMGQRPGEMMMLMRGTQAASLDKLFASAAKDAIAKKSVKALTLTRKNALMCGYPGMLVNVQLHVPSMPMAMQMAMTQGGGTAYVLMYTHMGTAPSDPAATAALDSLCVTGASPAPSASPAPTATPSPAATPTP